MATSTKHAGESGGKLCSLGCGRTLSEHALLAFCSACRSGIRYWTKKPPRARAERRHKLALYRRRLDEVSS